MLRIGAIALSIWGGINFLLAAFILVNVVLLKGRPPILYVVFTEAEMTQLSPKVIATATSLAILFNSCAAAFSLLVVIVVWTSLVRGQIWAFWGLAVTLALVQVMQFIADATIGNRTLPASIVLTVLYLAGIALSGYGLMMK